jgi:hypothetical protein
MRWAQITHKLPLELPLDRSVVTLLGIETGRGENDPCFKLSHKLAFMMHWLIV